MYYKIEAINNLNTDVDVTVIFYWLLAASAGRSYPHKKFKNLTNLNFKNLIHLQNLGHCSLTAS